MYNKGCIGVSIVASSPAQTLQSIVNAESAGVGTYWLTTAGGGPDALTLFAAAAARTKTIRLGTSIVPSFPRHPIVMVQQAEVVANLAPGRLILGIGPSHRPIIEGLFGLPFERPLEHLGEYIGIVKAALQTGKVDAQGDRFRVKARVPNPAPVPVMISALRANSFRLAGAAADGAISWITPPRYLHDVALPVMSEAAQKNNRQTPPLVAHCFLALSSDKAAVRRAAREQIAFYARLPFYQEMFVAAGHPEARSGEWSDGMIDAVVVNGNEAAAAGGLRQFMDSAGADELIVSVLAAGTGVQEANEAAIRLIGSL